jgi:hypothetical protein
MGLKVAISNKQTVMYSLMQAQLRGIDLAHRSILDKLLPTDSMKYGFEDFDSLYSVIVD